MSAIVFINVRKQLRAGSAMALPFLRFLPIATPTLRRTP